MSWMRDHRDAKRERALRTGAGTAEGYGLGRAIHCRSNTLHMQMVLLSIIRFIASSKLDRINKRTN